MYAMGVAEKTSPDRTDHNITLDQYDDRWEWRRKIRADPSKHLIYRVGVGVVGGLLLILAPLTGWLPGPGGIPLFIAGLAVLAREFEWAQRVLSGSRSGCRGSPPGPGSSRPG